MSTWLTIVGVTVSVYVLRASFILFADAQRFPHRFRQALKFVPPAVLAAIVLPGLVMPYAAFDMTLANPRWIAGTLAILLAVATRNATATIGIGMLALWLLQWAMG
jgi:branched-subunit amino acid transport protein